jgi:hypothetical protein
VKPRLLVTLCVLCVFCALAGAKEKEASGELLDSGSFGVYTSGQRIATETFSIKKARDGTVVSSEFKSEQGEQKAVQTSELELTPSVELRRYEWKESSPEKFEASVAPNDTFLIERFGNGDGKQQEQNFLLPASTSIMDDYFFIQREVLAWRFLASACREEKGAMQCPLNQKTQFGTLNPHARSSMPVTIEFAGRDKVSIRGTERNLLRFVLKAETGDWAFWLDDQDKFKLIRLQADGEPTEVVRD